MTSLSLSMADGPRSRAEILADRFGGYALALWIGWILATLHYEVPKIPWLETRSATLHVVQTKTIPVLQHKLAVEKAKPKIEIINPLGPSSHKECPQ